MSKRNFVRRLIMLIRSNVWTLISVALIIFSFFFLTRNIREIDILIQDSGVFAPLVAVIVYILLAPSPLPTDPITVFTGVLFGPLIGILVAWVGNSLGAMTEYFIGRSIGRSGNFNKIKKNLPFGLSRLPVGSIYVLTFGRAIPGYGGKIINLIAGMYEVSLATFAWTTVLINLIGATLLSFGGYGLVKLLHLR